MFAQFERLADTTLLVVVAVGVFIASAVFLALVAIAGNRRIGGRDVGARLTAAVCAAGGASIGAMLLFAPDVAVAAPLILVIGATVLSRLNSRHPTQAGWLALGTGLPILLAWLAALPNAGRYPDLVGTLEIGSWLIAGAGAAFIGAVLLLRGDPRPAAPDMTSPAGQPGSRSLGSIAEAIREPGMVGPFGLPEIAMLVAFVAVWLAVPFWIPRDAHVIVQIALPSLVSAVVATEAYLRAMPPSSRRAFEAFSWLGEWELARARQLTGASVPTNRDAALRWLAARPERVDRPAEAALRAEVLLLAEQIEAATRLVERMAERAATSWERFEIAALQDLVSWRAGGDGDIAGLEAAADAILPRDSDDRLRADVTVAVAKVRRRMADPRHVPGDGVAPLLDVRERLGRRADGQVGRALRRRLIPLLLIANVLFGIVTVVLGSLGARPI